MVLYGISKAKPLENKVVIVTGASGGIGRAVCSDFLAAGSKVLLASRTREALERTIKSFDRGRRNASYLAVDLREREECERLVGEAVDRYGRLDVLVNCAGIGTFARVEDLSDEDWNNTLALNVTAAFYLCRAAIPILRRQESGHIVHISSLAGSNPMAEGGAYCASKFALEGLTESMMMELREDGVKVTLICPGSVNTTFGGDKVQANSWKVDPEDIGRICVQVCSLGPSSMVSRVEIRPTHPGVHR